MPPAKLTWLKGPHGLSARTEGVLAINIAAVIFGTAALYGYIDVSPFWIVALRAGFGALALAPLGGASSVVRELSARQWGIIGLSGFLLAAHWLTFFVSVQLAGVAVATLTFATFPMFTVIVEAAQQRRWPSLAELTVAAVIVLAVALLFQSGDGEQNPAGAAAGLISALTYAFFWRVSRGLGTGLGAPTISFCQNVVVFALLAPALFFVEPAPECAIDWLSLAALGVINTALMLLIYLYALKRISASTCSGFIALEPVYAILFAALFFDEPVTWWIVISIMLILGASFTLLKLEKQPVAPHV